MFYLLKKQIGINKQLTNLSRKVCYKNGNCINNFVLNRKVISLNIKNEIEN